LCDKNRGIAAVFFAFKLLLEFFGEVQHPHRAILTVADFCHLNE
jgi:hypothetical protein